MNLTKLTEQFDKDIRKQFKILREAEDHIALLEKEKIDTMLRYMKEVAYAKK